MKPRPSILTPADRDRIRQRKNQLARERRELRSRNIGEAIARDQERNGDDSGMRDYFPEDFE
jgi:hypothetical protein